MTEQPLVSVIMNCFNGEKYLREAIDSVLYQTYKNWELIFWDNQSTDASAEIVDSYKDSRIQYFFAPKHTILYEARFHAVEQSKGEFLAFLDVDDWWEPKKLETQILSFSDPAVGLTCSNFIIHNFSEGHSYLAWKKTMPSGYIHHELLCFYHIGLLTIMMRRRCYDLIGGFDKRFHVIGDFDMSLRLAESWKVVSISEVLAHLRLHKTNETDKNKLLHINELKIWKEDAKHRKISFQDSGM